jgi:hypothetical protein
MERARDGFDASALQDDSLAAANDALIVECGPATGWDPFEVWRTRVRDAREPRPRRGDKTPS